MKINRHIIRGYDIRGVADQDLNPEIMEHFGKAYGTYMAGKGMKKIVVGRDARLTSEEYKDCFIKGILSTGLDAIDVNLSLVGHIYWSQYHFKTIGTAMITALVPAKASSNKLVTNT